MYECDSRSGEGRLVDATMHAHIMTRSNERCSNDPATNNAEQGERPEGRRERPETVSSTIIINKKLFLLANKYLFINSFFFYKFLFHCILFQLEN